WWAAYPYACLEQTVGKAIGLSDVALWQRTMAQLPTYLDDDGWPCTSRRKTTAARKAATA
ncbi:MAG: hypothetical protein KBT18_09520, partial [Comamonas sp.]|nr:hypothetical protein [Candidatus Comamonas equi]